MCKAHMGTRQMCEWKKKNNQGDKMFRNIVVNHGKASKEGDQASVQVLLRSAPSYML